MEHVISAKNGGALSESSLQRRVKRLVAATGIEDLTCYTFRHNYMTMLDEHDVPPTTAMTINGHTDYEAAVLEITGGVTAPPEAE